MIEENHEKTPSQVGRHRDFNQGPPECESRALPRSHLAMRNFELSVNDYFYRAMQIIQFLHCFVSVTSYFYNLEHVSRGYYAFYQPFVDCQLFL